MKFEYQECQSRQTLPKIIRLTKTTKNKQTAAMAGAVVLVNMRETGAAVARLVMTFAQYKWWLFLLIIFGMLQQCFDCGC